MSYEITDRKDKVIATIDSGDINVWSETGDYIFVDLYCGGEVFSHTIWDAYDRKIINRYGAELSDKTLETIRDMLEVKLQSERKLWQE